MTGRRVYPNAEGHLVMAEGDYGLDPHAGWMVRPPGCHAGSISKHTVVEHEDGTITVSPSILHYGIDGKQAWHGYLERGVWRTC